MVINSITASKENYSPIFELPTKFLRNLKMSDIWSRWSLLDRILRNVLL